MEKIEKTNKNNFLSTEQEIEDTQYDSKAYTHQNAPDEFKYKFNY